MTSPAEPQPSATRRNFLLGSAAVGAGLASGAVFSGSAAAADAGHPPGTVGQVLANNVGYELNGPKQAVIADNEPFVPSRPFEVLDVNTGAVAYRGTAHYVGPVPDWAASSFPTVPTQYWVADFSGLATAGRYVVQLPGAGYASASAPFWIEADVLERRALSHMVHYFKDSRSCGQYDKFDRSLPMQGSTTARYDAHGGWYDAAADWGKHFTQLSDVSYFNTLSIPLTAWVLLRAYDALAARNDQNLTSLLSWTLDEGLFGADFLTRVHVRGSSFYGSIEQPEADDLGIDPTQRSLSTHQVDYREGGGLAIAALARASTYPVSGDYTSAEYLAAAQDAFAFLQVNNVKMTNDGKENILDDYNALLAATELFKATHNAIYQQAADTRAQNLVNRLVSWTTYQNYWRADDVDRPFFHPSDAGLPVVSLLNYLDIAGPAMRTSVLATVTKSLRFELAVTHEVCNPFGYARQLVQDSTGKRYSGFFFPHNVTPRSQDQWWQGENARLASLATAARMVAKTSTDASFTAQLRTYAANQLNWIVGVNPFNVCMMDGPGRENPLYLEYFDTNQPGSWRWLRSAGGIVNGITGRAVDGSGI
ncbi:MAG TPA: glycoside hydrolase family 9 protein, partial [Pseudonocardiaceae bacterium]